jgi:type I restriction enzyme S subunit
MSKLDELIEKLCPNGVEYKKLCEMTEVITKGTTPSSIGFGFQNDGINFIKIESIDSNGNFIKEKMEHISDECNEKLKRSQLRENDILFSIAGAIGRTCIVNKEILPANTNQALAIIRISKNSKLNTRYLFYTLQASYIKIQYEKNQKGSAQINVSLKNIGDFEIAVPPLEVQCEIVHILDDFTLLSAELSAELKARQKQFEYYRNNLINNNSSIEVSLKEIVKKSCSGGTPLKSKKEFYENGTIPWLRTQEVKFNEIYEISELITEEAVKSTSAKWIPENCVIVALSGASAGRCAINKIKTTTNQHCLNLEIDSSKALYKYIFYCVCSKYNDLISRKEGARGDLNSSKILGLKIPLPSLEEQEKIVKILDRFDKLCTNISEGLPAEIEKRQKQYEYYRDKLLTFKELEVNE